MQTIALWLYSLALWLAQPLLRRKLRRRAVNEPGYAVAVPERFGRYAQPVAEQGGPLVWIHAVSLGETRAAGLLLAAIRAAQPDVHVLLTHGTATGRQEGMRLLQPGDMQVWLPWDAPGPVRRFLELFRPRVGLLMETEMWPELLAQSRESRRRRVPGEKLARVRLESEYGGLQAAVCGMCDQAAEQGAMTEVHTVEIADGEHGRGGRHSL